MPEQSSTLSTDLDAASIAPEVFELRPDYRALLLVVDGLLPAPSNEITDALVNAAEARARSLLDAGPVEELPHVAAWRDAYRAFGAKPQRTRNSLESLLRRAESGLPRVNALTDIYNAISVLHQVPLGGEDLNRCQGAPRLIRATGAEPFDTTAAGESVVEYPAPGEVVWCDEVGVTCRRWNWRQGKRTGLTDATTTAVFILDALEPMSDDGLQDAAGQLAVALRRLGLDVSVATRMIAA